MEGQEDFITQSTAKYYGVRTRNEYRLTKFGRDFEFLKDDYVGSLLIMTRKHDGEYNAYVLSDQTNIEDFMAHFNLDVTKGNQIIKGNAHIQPDELVATRFQQFVQEHNSFPDTVQMAAFARKCVSAANHYTQQIIANKADTIILKWIDAEYQLFSAMEEKLYHPVYSQPFLNCQDLIDFSNSILNR